VAAAEQGARVLLVSTDPAHSLGDCLGRRLGPRPTRVPTRRGRLEAVELDAARALARWLEARRRPLRAILERGTYLSGRELDRLLALPPPGVDELVVLLELERLARRAPWDRVVVDAAPTGHALRLLATPATLRRAAAVLAAMQGKHHLLVTRLVGATRRDAGDLLVDELAGLAGAIERLLREQAAFTWVLTPEVLALEEATDAVAALEAAAVRVDELVINRLTPPAPCRACAARRRVERAVLARAARWAGARPVRLIPDLPREPRGPAALRAVAARLAARARLPREARAGAPTIAPAPRAGDEAWLDRLAPEGLRLLVVAGKGGVGKTSCAAAVALALARRPRGRRVLLLSTDPAHSLADVLGAPVGDAERAVPGAPPTFRAREFDAAHAVALERDRYRKAVGALVDAVRGGGRFDLPLDRAILEDLLDLAPAGLDEALGLLAVVAALGGQDAAAPYDTVVLDTAPTGHALRLLALPEVALTWAQALAALLRAHGAPRAPDDLGAALAAAARDLRRLRGLLGDPARTRVVAVARATALAYLETRRLLAALARLGLPLGALVVNALTAGCRHGPRAREDARLLAAYRRLARSSRRDRCAIILSPSVVPPPRGPAALERWRRAWEAEVDGAGR